MAHLYQLAASRGIPRLSGNVTLTAEPFFNKCGFVVEVRRQVTVRDMVLANARMSKPLPTNLS